MHATRNTSTLHTGKGIHARRRVALTPRQPLRPRFSARRCAVLLVLLCASISILAQQNQAQLAGFINRPVTTVHLESPWQQVNEREITRLLQGTLGRGFFQVNVAQVKATLERHPWVAHAAVKRVWPDSLSLQITEHVAIARWGERALLNQHGEIFAPADISMASHLPRLRGPAESQFQVMQQYQQFSQILFPAGLKLTELEMSARGSWKLTVNETLEIAVGRTALTEKLERFVEFYGKQPKTNSDLFEAVDLRYGNGIAVRSRQEDLSGVAIR